MNLRSVPPNVVGFFVIIGTSWSSDHFKERLVMATAMNETHTDSPHSDAISPRHIIAGLSLTATGYLLLAVTTNVPVRYLGLCFAVSFDASKQYDSLKHGQACTNAGVIPFLAYRTATVTGATSTAIATGEFAKQPTAEPSADASFRRRRYRDRQHCGHNCAVSLPIVSNLMTCSDVVRQHGQLYRLCDALLRSADCWLPLVQAGRVKRISRSDRFCSCRRASR